MNTRTFRGRLMNAKEAIKALEGDATDGIAKIRVAVFGTPDTNLPVGVEERQVIDQGAFADWIRTRDASEPVPFFLDHGDAMFNDFGIALAEKKVGYANGFAEDEQGLDMETHYNLRTQRGHDAFADLIHDPNGTQFSFRWPPDEVVTKGPDGLEHVVRFSGIMEVSQVGIAAQRGAGLVELVGARTAIASHSTATDGGAWDAGANERRLPNTEAALRKAFAWVDPEGDPTVKNSYKFIHHFVGQDGSVNAASTRACSNGIGILNGGRGGANIPDADRAGVHRHLARHLSDANMTPPPLRAGFPDEDDVKNWLEVEPEFASELAGWMGMEVRAAELSDIIDTDEFLSKFRAALKEKSDLVETFRAICDDSAKPAMSEGLKVAAEFYESLARSA